MSLHANISYTPFEQKSPQPPEEGVLNCHRQTNKQTSDHNDSMTKSAQRAKYMLSVRVYVNCFLHYIFNCSFDNFLFFFFWTVFLKAVLGLKKKIQRNISAII